MVLSIRGLPDSPGVAAAGVLVAVNTTWRTWRPLNLAGNDRVGSALLLLDLAIHLTAAVLSGGWESAYVFTVVVDVLLAGFGRGYPEAFTAAGLSVAALVVAGTVAPPDRFIQPVSQVTLLYLVSAFVAGYARDLFLEVEERQEEAAGRLARLTEANQLLSELHRVAQTLPSSLDLKETLAAAVARLRDLFDLTAVTVLVLDPATDTWRVGMAEGLRLPAELPPDRLPPAVGRAVAERASVTEADSWSSGAGGLSPRARSGLYAPLVARGRLVGLAAVEHTEPERFGPREVGLLEGLAEPLALAIDNALWFGRLQVLGAEGERSRMARQLHDRIGQGLAYVALELDRIRARHEGLDELAQLAEDTRGLLGEVKETLRQLRAEVSESASLAVVAQGHLERFTARTGIEASFRTGEREARLPVSVERELWRILQEALLNVERHSGAQRVWVTWDVEGPRGRLQVRDDGRGFDLEAARRVSSGMLAMRERANAVGGRLRIQTAPGEGTVITVETEVRA